MIRKYVCVEDTYMYAIHDGEFLCLTMCELTRQGAFSSAFYRFASLCRVCFKRVPDGHRISRSVNGTMPGIGRGWSWSDVARRGCRREGGETKEDPGRSIVVEEGARKGRSLRTRRYDFSFNNHDGTIPARRITLPTCIQRISS